MKMSHKANSSRTPLNVMGCQWQSAEKTNLPPAACYMSIVSAHQSNGPDCTTSTSISEEMDLKLENERRLQEMREQGKQCLMDRDEQNVREEGAANLLARFHSMQWMRHPHTEPAATTTTSQSNIPLDNCQVNLVPVKHGEEEYFSGTRQQKRSRRPKNVRPKCEIVKLEEIIPAPTEKILPACYQPMPCNVWSQRKGSELFSSRKLSLTIYDPADDSEALFQRAVEESLITLAQEQDRIVNMYSSVPKDDVPVQLPIAAQLPNDTWDGERGTCIGGGAGDGTWMKDDFNGNRLKVCQGKMNSITAPGEDNSKCELHLPENSGYSGRRRITKAQQGSYRSGNFSRDHQAKIAYQSRDSVDNQCQESSYSSLCNQQKRPSRMDAGDCYYKDSSVRDQVDGRGHKKDIKEKNRDVRNKTYFNKYKTDKNSNNGNLRKSYGGENKEADLESLGFNKSRTAQYAQRETVRRRQGEDLHSREHPKACGYSERQEKQHPRVGDHHGHENSRVRHINSCDPHASSGKNGRLSSQVSFESDDDPWLEPEERVEMTQEDFCPLAHIQPCNETPNRCPTPKQDGNPANLFVDKTGKSKVNPSRTVIKSPSLKTPLKEIGIEKASVNANEDETVRMEKASQPVKDSATSPGAPGSPGPLEVSSTVEDSLVNGVPDESEAMKKMREELDFLENRLKQLSTAMEHTHVDIIAQHPCSDPKTEPTAPQERQMPARMTTPTPAEVEAKPTSVPLLNLWFESLSGSLSHPLARPPPVPVVHPLAHPLAHPVTHALTHDHSAIHSQAHSQMHLQGYSQTHPNQQANPQPHLNSQVHPQAHFQAQSHPQVLSQAQLQGCPQTQPQEHSLPQTHGHPQPQTQLYVQQPLQTQEGEPANQSGVETLQKALLAQLQQGLQASNANMTPELQIQITQYLAQQRQNLAMQAAAAASAASAVSSAPPPGCTPNPMPLNWLGLQPGLPHGTGNWLLQGMHPSTVPAAQGMHPSAVPAAQGMHPSAVPAAQGMHPDAISAVHAANQAAMANQTNIGCTGVETGVDNPLAADSAILKNACTSTNAVPVGEIGAPAHMQWFAQMKAFHLQHQQQMMQLSVMPGMHPSLPVQPLLPPLVPPAVGVSGQKWVPGPFPGMIPPQYEGDWIISPADEARLGQGPPLVPNENTMQSSQGKYDIPGASNFSDAARSPTGPVHALNLAVAASVKPTHPPAPLVKPQNMDAQIDAAATIATENSFRNLHQAAAHVMGAPRMRPGESRFPEEPRGRGRLR